jgi:hypothetical protein
MKRQTLKALLMLSLIVMGGIAISTTDIQAQTMRDFRARIPFGFTVNNRAFPAGEYSIERTLTGSSKDVLSITNLNEPHARRYVLVMSEALPKSVEESTLIFNVYDEGRYFLSQVMDTIEGRGIRLPLSHTEKELARSTSGKPTTTTTVAAIRSGR